MLYVVFPSVSILLAEDLIFFLSNGGEDATKFFREVWKIVGVARWAAISRCFSPCIVGGIQRSARIEISISRFIDFIVDSCELRSDPRIRITRSIQLYIKYVECSV